MIVLFSEERASAIRTLVQAKNPDVQGVLLEALNHPIADVRGHAVEGLGEIGDASAVPAICEALLSANWSVREAAVQALGEIGDASAVPALRELLTNPISDRKFIVAEILRIFEK